jgi:hypothetical protein
VPPPPSPLPYRYRLPPLSTMLALAHAPQAKIDDADCWNLGHVVTMAKAALRVPPDDADVRLLSGGERRRVALCRLLLEQVSLWGAGQMHEFVAWRGVHPLSVTTYAA